MKACTKCGVLKPFKLFSKSKNRPNGVSSHCLTCKNAQCKTYRDKNPEKCKLAISNWGKRNSNRKRKYSLTSYYRHLKVKKQLARTYKQNHKESVKNYMKKWRQENKDKIKEYYKNNKAWFKTWNAERRAKMSCVWANSKKIKDIYAQAIQLSIETGIPHHVDHVLPLTHNKICGLHCENNLQILTASENLAKLNKFRSYQIVHF